MSDDILGIVIAGASGRMGRALIRAVSEEAGMQVIGATEAPGSEHLGKDAGTLAGIDPLGVQVTDDPLPLIAKAQGLIDFTAPAATIMHADLCAQARIVHVIGTTGMTEDDEERLNAAARHATLIQAGNMSVGVNLLTALTEKVAGMLDDRWDIEVLEMHHRHKVDAPSGTAKMLGEAAAMGRGVKLSDVRDAVRDGHTGARKQGDIGFATLRGGSVVGEHTVIFATENERVELTHRAEDRTIFARGAVVAVKWGQGKGPGRFDMLDVLAL